MPQVSLAAGVIDTPRLSIYQQPQDLIALAERYRLPAIYGYRLFAADGGLDNLTGLT